MLESPNKFDLLINYLNLFSLKTNKQKSFTKWCKIDVMVQNKEHLTEEEFNNIKIMSKDANT